MRPASHLSSSTGLDTVKHADALPIHPPARKVKTALIGLLIAGWFFAHSWRGLLSYFTSDDIMNMYWARELSLGKLALSVFVPFTDVYRPTGGALYRLLFSIFGLQPLPFHIIAYALLLLNMLLIYKLAGAMTGRASAGILAACLASFHNRFVDLYLNNGTTYDILCGSFYLGTVLFYVTIRSRHGSFRRWQLALLYLLATAALNAKETAATLPVVLLTYELVCLSSHWPPERRPFKGWLQAALPLSVVALVMAMGTWARFRSGSRLMHNDAYVFHLSAGLPNTAAYLNDLFCLKPAMLNGFTAVLIILALFGLARWTRSRVLLFWAVWILISPLPVTFISQRALYAFYIPVLGWAAFIATAINLLVDWLKSRPAPRSLLRISPVSAWSPALAALLMIAYVFANDRPIPWQDALPRNSNLYSLSRDLLASVPAVPNGSHLLLLNDAFPPDDWIPLMLVRLTYNNLELELVRPKQRTEAVTPRERATSVAVFEYVNGRTVRVN